MYFGAFAPDDATGVSTSSSLSGIASFESDAHKAASIVQSYQHWGDATNSFPTAWMTAVRQHGSIPLLTWTSTSLIGGAYQSTYALKSIADGAFDSYITKWAQDAKAWGHPFFLRFDHEMNAQSYPYSEGVNGNQPGSYVAVWRHVRDIFTANGATNATWVWCPTVESQGALPLSELYPGDAYVDWTCIDGYNWGTSQFWSSQQSFAQVLAPTYDDVLRIAPTKALMIGEMSSADTGGTKAQWIGDALTTQIPRSFPRIKAVVWFNLHIDGILALASFLSPVDFRIESSPASQEAFASAIADPRYASNQYATLNASPIPPPDNIPAPAASP